MKPLRLVFIFSFLLLACCGKNDLETFCEDTTARSFDPNFKAYLTGIEATIPLKHFCPPIWRGISPPISWKGVHKGATNLHILVENATCTSRCNECCKYHHWRLDIPLDSTIFPFKNAIPEGASTSPLLEHFTPDWSRTEQWSWIRPVYRPQDWSRL